MTEIKNDLNKVLVTNAALNKVVRSYKNLRQTLLDALLTSQRGSTEYETDDHGFACEKVMEDEYQRKRPRREAAKISDTSPTLEMNEKQKNCIDITMSETKQEEISKRPSTTLQPITFGILPTKLKVLKQKCQDYGIDEYAKDAEELKKRLQRFQQFWNSEVSRPETNASKSEILANFNREERARHLSNHPNYIISSSKMDGAPCKKWSEVLLHRDGFDDVEPPEENDGFVSLVMNLKRQRLETYNRPWEQVIYHSKRKNWLDFDVDTKPSVPDKKPMHPIGPAVASSKVLRGTDMAETKDVCMSNGMKNETILNPYLSKSQINRDSVCLGTTLIVQGQFSKEKMLDSQVSLNPYLKKKGEWFIYVSLLVILEKKSSRIFRS